MGKVGLHRAKCRYNLEPDWTPDQQASVLVHNERANALAIAWRDARAAYYVALYSERDAGYKKRYREAMLVSGAAKEAYFAHAAINPTVGFTAGEPED